MGFNIPKSLDWFVGENLNRKPWFLPSNIGLSCIFSHHPILWQKGPLNNTKLKPCTANWGWIGGAAKIGGIAAVYAKEVYKPTGSPLEMTNFGAGLGRRGRNFHWSNGNNDAHGTTPPRESRKTHVKTWEKSLKKVWKHDQISIQSPFFIMVWSVKFLTPWSIPGMRRMASSITRGFGRSGTSSEPRQKGCPAMKDIEKIGIHPLVN